MRRFVPALLVAAALVAVGGAVTAYLTLVRPLRVLPRPLAQIEADWDDVSRRLPPVPEAEAVDPALLELVDRFLDDEQRADATRELTRWLRRNDVPDPGCTLLADDGPSPISTMRWYEVGKHLGEERQRIRVLKLTEELHDRELLGLMIAQVLMAETFHRPIPTDHVLAATRREVVCTDAALSRLYEGAPGVEPVAENTWPVDLMRERWVYRDHMARLLLALEGADGDGVRLRGCRSGEEPPARVGDTRTALELGGVGIAGGNSTRHHTQHATRSTPLCL